MYKNVNYEESGESEDLVPTYNIFAISECVFVNVCIIYIFKTSKQNYCKNL